MQAELREMLSKIVSKAELTKIGVREINRPSCGRF